MPVAGLVGEFDAKSVPGLSWLEPCLRPDRIVSYLHYEASFYRA
jgi:hypothetical protein